MSCMKSREHMVSPEELRRAKDHLKGSSVLGLESTSSRMGNLARQELYFKRLFTLDEMLERIEEVTAGRSAGWPRSSSIRGRWRWRCWDGWKASASDGRISQIRTYRSIDLTHKCGA